MTAALELMGIIPRSFPKNWDVTKEDISGIADPERKVFRISWDTNLKRRATEMLWIYQNVKVKKALGDDGVQSPSTTTLTDNVNSTTSTSAHFRRFSDAAISPGWAAHQMDGQTWR